jgi:glycosyltransferase involved in cell wall biosynthesis
MLRGGPKKKTEKTMPARAGTTTDNCGAHPLSHTESTVVGYSIIICTHDRAELLGKCLRAAIRETASVDAPGEILVVDNASRDQTRDVFDACVEQAGHVRLVYLFEVKPNLCIARNRGLDAALGDIVIFLDDDAIVADGWLKSCPLLSRRFRRRPWQEEKFFRSSRSRRRLGFAHR